MAVCPNCGAAHPERARFCSECGAALAAGQAPPPETRRTVTVLFCDLVGSTALGESMDPEAVRMIMSRYFSTMSGIIERHGGTVEKYIGDAIMAIFGLPSLHEDDALRAVRAASEMRAALTALNLDLGPERGVTIATRTGVHTGEVVAGDASTRQMLVTGDTVNTAARLEQAAGAGEILLGGPTWHLVRGAVVVEPVEPIRAKGKAEPLSAVRLVSVAVDVHAGTRSAATPIIGRDGELARLREVFASVTSGRRPGLVTILGPAGVGKSRLVAEFAREVSDHASVLRGRCLPYGEGITYWPLRQIIHAAAGITEADSADDGMRKLVRLVDGPPDAAVIAARLASAIGLSADPAPGDEIYWAARRTLEQLAVARPLVVVIEDVHWAEPTLLELIGHLVAFTGDVPLLLVCLARSDFRDTAMGWVADRPGDAQIELDALPATAATGLIDAIAGGFAIPPAVRDQILATAEGNPLFLEEMVRMLAEDGGTRPDAAIQVPPSIRALMAARVDRLPDAERSTARRASVAGRAFEEAAVAALTPDGSRSSVRPALDALVGRDLVRPDHADLSDGEAFRFRHLLIRDAAYEALPKAERADLHALFADWLEHAAGDRVTEYEELLGYHLDQAFRYRTDLRLSDERTMRLGVRAGGHLRAAAGRARAHGDSAAAVRLFALAEAAPSTSDTGRSELLLESGLALADLSRTAEAEAHALESLAIADAAGDRRLAARARVLLLDAQVARGSIASSDAAYEAALETALTDARAAGDPLALALAEQALAYMLYEDGDLEGYGSHLRTALEHARASEDVRLQLELETGVLIEAVVGPMPADDIVALAGPMLERAAANPSVEADMLRLVAVPEAMLEQFDTARSHAERSIAVLQDLGQPQAAAIARTDLAWVHRLAGDLVAAESELRLAIAESEPLGDRTTASVAACRLAQVLLVRGALDEAAALVDIAEAVPIVMNRSRVAGIRALISAHRGDSATRSEVAALLAMVEDVHMPNIRIDAFMDAAEALALVGDSAQAADLARQALALAVAKGNRPRAAQVRALLTRLDTPAADVVPPGG